MGLKTGRELKDGVSGWGGLLLRTTHCYSGMPKDRMSYPGSKFPYTLTYFRI